MQNITDFEIIESILNGNTGDYNIIIDRYKHRAFSLLKRMLRNELDAEEALQDSFVKAYFNLKAFRKDAKFSTWFYRIVYNTALNKIESKAYKKDQSTTGILGMEEALTIPGESFAGKERAEILDALCSRLSPQYASVLNLFYFEGLSCEEIAGIINLSVANVKVLLHRARTKLKQIIESNHLEEELL